MLRPRNIVVIALITLVVAAAWATASGVPADQKSVLSGRVLADSLTVPGTDVCEGAVLVYVDTIVGPAPAVRANIDGKVKEVLVRPGDSIRPGDVVVRIDPARK